jgi:hypothetical protein
MSDDQHDAPEDEDSGDVSYDEQLEAIRLASLKLAQILQNPGVNSALKREEMREQAFTALSRCINALALMCEAAHEYATAMSMANAVETAVSAEPPTPSGGEKKA